MMQSNLGSPQHPQHVGHLPAGEEMLTIVLSTAFCLSTLENIYIYMYISSSDRFRLKPTGEEQIFLSKWKSMLHYLSESF